MSLLIHNRYELQLTDHIKPFWMIWDHKKAWYVTDSCGERLMFSYVDDAKEYINNNLITKGD
mgnify:CR=1 FL=1